MKKYICYICLLLLFCAACKHASVENKNTEQKQPEKEQEVEIQGEVFVVTKGAQNIKLGLVEVIAIPEDQITTYLENKKREADTRRTELESASIRAESEYFKAQSDLDRAQIQSREVMRRYEELIEKISQSRSYGYSPTQTQAEAVAEKGLYAMREKMNQFGIAVGFKKARIGEGETQA